jgi:hypothetical protein
MKYALPYILLHRILGVLFFFLFSVDLIELGDLINCILCCVGKRIVYIPLYRYLHQVFLFYLSLSAVVSMLGKGQTQQEQHNKHFPP